MAISDSRNGHVQHKNASQILAYGRLCVVKLDETSKLKLFSENRKEKEKVSKCK